MPKRLIIYLAMFFFLFYSTSFAMATDIKPGDFLVLCYHAIPVKAHPGDKYSIPQHVFVEHMEYLHTHGYHPVSLDDILEASAGKKTLPKNPVLLTFDDAYISYYRFVVPVLEKFGYSSVLAVVSTFIGNPPKDIPEELMSWGQIREVASKRLVQVVSHSYDLHKGIQYNPQGNIGPAVSIRRYDPDTKKYETEDRYRARLKADFKSQAEIFEKELGFTPKAIVWPFGQHNSISREVAQNEGYRFGFSLEWGVGNINNLRAIKRILMENEPMEDSIENITKPGRDESVMQMRAVQVDLDLIYDPTSYEKTDENLGKLINRLVEMKVNTVFLQAFSDPEGTGNIKSVYFYNSVLPVRGDIFSHAVHQMVIRNMNVYAWLPTLSIVLPDEKLNEELRVCEIVEGGTRASQSWYQRLTPFSSDVRELVRRLYEELAVHSQINGILFQDDAYLTDREDYHPLALSSYKEYFGEKFFSLDEDPELSMQWAQYKTGILIDFTKNLMEGIRKYRPGTEFARNIYASLVTEPESEKWFAQNYERFLQTYDQVVIMAYPQMEGIERPSSWLGALVRKAKEFPNGIEKTVFKVQAFDWKKNAWLDDGIVLEELRDVLASGGRHIAYYPDNFWVDKPCLKKIKLEMSTKKYPFL